jgi:hypothetical protein
MDYNFKLMYYIEIDEFDILRIASSDSDEYNEYDISNFQDVLFTEIRHILNITTDTDGHELYTDENMVSLITFVENVYYIEKKLNDYFCRDITNIIISYIDDNDTYLDIRDNAYDAMVNICSYGEFLITDDIEIFCNGEDYEIVMGIEQVNFNSDCEFGLYDDISVNKEDIKKLQELNKNIFKGRNGVKLGLINMGK